MRTNVARALLPALLALLLGACGATAQPAAPATPNAMPATDAMAEPTADAMGDAMAEPTADAMGDTMAEPTPDAMAEPTADAMGDTMAEPTPDAMAEPTADAMGDTMAEPTADAMGDTMAEPTPDAMAEPTPDAMGDTMGDTMGDKAAWQQVALTNARTGETFTLGDFAGRTVYVEPMATWCSKCREMLGNVRDARAQLDGEQFVFVSLSVETDISAADLARYADEQGFDWTFAVLTPEALRELSDAFGLTVANPPATPHFVIRPDGTVGDLETGVKPADAIVTSLGAASGG